MSAGIKTILIIGLVQLAAIVLLFGRIAALESDMHDSNATSSEANPNDHLSLSSFTQGGASSLNADQIRQIVREELQAFSAPQEDSQVAQADAVVGKSLQEQDDDQRFAVMSDKLDFYMSDGYVDQAEIARFASEIADLDQAQKEVLVRRMMKAVNSGQIVGEF